MARISSKALNAGGNDNNCGCPNKKGFNGNEIQNKEFSDGTGLEFYDFNARTYDQQIGRFIQVDPLSDEGKQESQTPYQFLLNNPVLFNDPDGKCPLCPAIPLIIDGGCEGCGGSQLSDVIMEDGSRKKHWRPKF